MAGRGRGGRGAQLLQALDTPVRRPGQTKESFQAQLSSRESASSGVSTAGSSVSFPSTQSSATPSSASAYSSHDSSKTPPPPTAAMAAMTMKRESPPGSAGPSRTSPEIRAAAAPSPSQSGGSPPSSHSSISGSSSSSDKRSSASSSSGKVSLDAPTPQRGTTGEEIPLCANYIAVKSTTQGVFQYCVKFDPEVDNRNMRYGMMNEHKDVIGDTKAFDGSTLFLPHELSDKTTVVQSKRQTDSQPVNISITLTRIVPHDECHQLYNIVFRRVMRCLNLKQVGRSHFNPNTPIMVPQHKLEIWPGYVTSIQSYDGGLMLMCDVSHRLLRTDSVLSFMSDMYSASSRNFQENFMKQIVGTVVLTRYNNKTHRVDDIAWDMNPLSTFKDSSGEEICFLDYYRKHYEIKIEDKEQPLLISRVKRLRPRRHGDAPDTSLEEEVKICLIPELCSMTGLTDQAREDFRVMKDIAQHTRITPNQRQVAMKKFVDNINATPEARHELTRWGLALDPTMTQLSGRVLPREKILTHHKTLMVNAEADFSRDVTREKCITAVNLDCWVVVCTQRDRAKATDFIMMMKQVGPSFGMAINDPVTIHLENDRTDTYLRSIRQAVQSELQMVVSIFPTKRDDRYNAVKKLCCVESPVPSQCINTRTIGDARKLRSVTQKIALQMNCKMGGELWAVEMPVKNLMVVGIDTYHDKQSRSVGGFVASTNQSITRWYSRVCFQERGQELVDGLRGCLMDAIRNYHEINHTLPDRIVVFRDGVGDGQMSTVRDYEVRQLVECFKHFGDNYKPRMAMVIVQKRISTRVFFRGHQLENPPPGTVVDHTVTRKDVYDFFLVSQHVRQGTVTPTHYTVVHDTTGFQANHMQRLAYKMTHMYYNWPGTIRAPAPCQYAHKLAFLVGQSLQRDPDRKLSDRLFFL
ncbi:piwi-like protein 1 [Sycon ciliatum]|uniref:piwi-like protein 1 n=1 Tax=Sycon ciliatum TaxID=27933 RepID=UPI0031F64DD5